MKIIDDKYQTNMEIAEIFPGNVFEFEGIYYLKIDDRWDSDNNIMNCVSLEEGELQYRHGEALVVDGAFVVGEK